ncbi:traB domain-containing protein-like [Eupeodes corollae]|uniref:traB domain-containing protein-like n=1 Tax=Eupeodes corollae TaxID=290404 RepID=UPI002493182B|nr:traB domain-containing protein-like [Eupeodes corollae]
MNNSLEIPIYRNQADFEQNLPKTVEVLKTKEGNKVFLVGTVHFSLKSHHDVSTVIRNTNPSVVMLELCPLRKHMLDIDEETLLREASALNLRRISEIFVQKGLINGMFYLSFLRTNAKITKQLGVAPGGECRRAVEECKKLKHCKVLLGDRPIDITMQRALSPLTWRDKLMLSSIFNEPSISQMTPADVEAYKNRDIDYLRNLRLRFPSVYRSFVTERDQILAHNLMLATKLSGRNYCNVVGVVGVGHMNGICESFGQTKPEEIMKMMKQDLTPRPQNNGHNIIQNFSRILNIFKHK